MPKPIRWLFTALDIKDNEKKYQIEMLNTVIVIAFVTMVAYITLAILKSDQSPLLFMGVFTLLLIFIFVWWLMRRGYIYLTRLLLLTFFPVGLTVLIVQSGLGLQNPLINGYLIFIIVATMVLGARSGL